METSPSIHAASHFLEIVWGGETPSDSDLLSALDRLVASYHDAPDTEPDTSLEAPRSGGPSLHEELARRFPNYGLYPVSDPTADYEAAASMGDAIDDLADLTLDMREVVWLAEHAGANDAHWSFRLHYFHWGQHARELGLYLHARRLG